ncbi:hypothetical protein DFH11DRAFT_1725201 [Phellopilus nigrolimitatus]|nr:hypothetical protein DFH11DRAFT_1725201 [Phellopilus nigrolimitatus]
MVEVLAPSHGKIRVKVPEGSYVKEGDIIAVQVSAKTESNVKAPTTGRITFIVSEATPLNEKDLVAKIE